jgi:general secretion pathway protein E
MSALPAESQPRRLGEILVARGKLDAPNLERALRLQETETREKLGVILNRLGLVSARDLADALSEQSGLSVAGTAEYPDLPLFEEQISYRFLRDAKALPLRETDEGIVVAMADPADEYTARSIAMVCGKPVIPRLAVTTELDAALERLYGAGRSSLGQIVDDIATRDEEQDLGDVEHLKDLASEAPVVRLVNLLIAHALDARASDIHIEPFENRLIVRYRIDGVLNEVESPPRRLSAAVISRV